MRQDEFVNIERFRAWLKSTIRSPHYRGDNEHWERILSDDLHRQAGCVDYTTTEFEFTAPASITISGEDESITIHREDFIAPEDLIEGATDEDQEWSTRYIFKD